MAKKRRKAKKSKASVGLVIVVNTDNDDALDLVVDAAESLVAELEDEVDLTVTFAANLPPAEDDDEDDEPEVDEDDDLDEDDDEEEEEPEEEEDDEDEEDAEELTEEYLEDLSLAELKKVAKAHGVAVVKGKRSATYIRELLALSDEDEEEPEEPEVDEDEDDEDEDDYLTLADLKKMNIKKLKGLAKEYGIKVRTSWGKSDIIDAIVEVAGDDEE